MKALKDLGEKNLSPLLQALEGAINTLDKPLAAFDADGTLWDTDIGENFFQFQARNQLVELPAKAWEFYLDWHEKDPIPAYLWLAQINAGKPLSEVRSWAKAAVDEQSPLPIFTHMKSLVEFLHAKDVEVYVVTASVKWAVEPAAELLGIPHDHVIGIETDTQNGLVTKTQKGAITWREGKVQGLLEKTEGRFPFFAAGNTTGDLHLLKSSTHLALAHSATHPENPIHPTEIGLLDEALKNDWYRLRIENG